MEVWVGSGGSTGGAGGFRSLFQRSLMGREGHLEGQERSEAHPYALEGSGGPLRCLESPYGGMGGVGRPTWRFWMGQEGHLKGWERSEAHPYAF